MGTGESLPTALYRVAGGLGGHSSGQDRSSNKDYGSEGRIGAFGKGLAFTVLIYPIF